MPSCKPAPEPSASWEGHFRDGGRGAEFELREVHIDEPGMTPMEIWSNESQERYVLAIKEEQLEAFKALCERERCPVYVKAIGKALQDEPARMQLLTHENGVQVDDSVKRLFPNHAEHDPSDLPAALKIAADDSVLPLGILYRNPDAPCYDDMSVAGLEMGVQEKLAGLNEAFDHFAI